MANNSGQGKAGSHVGDGVQDISLKTFLSRFEMIQKQNAFTINTLAEVQKSMREEFKANRDSVDARLKRLEEFVAAQDRNKTPLQVEGEDDYSESRYFTNRPAPKKSQMTRIPGPTGRRSDRYVCPKCNKNYADSYILLHVRRATCVRKEEGI